MFELNGNKLAGRGHQEVVEMIKSSRNLTMGLLVKGADPQKPSEMILASHEQVLVEMNYMPSPRTGSDAASNPSSSFIPNHRPRMQRTRSQI